MPLVLGTKLVYEIQALLGARGMGEVYRARDPRLGRTVAVKVSHENFTQRFEREARSAAALNHPNICQLYDIGPNYLVMEYVDGAPIAPGGGFRKILDTAEQIADGMAAAHTAGIVHRDLKPDNILITAEARIKILDFGLAKQAASAPGGDATQTVLTAATNPGTVMGTVFYMSPEQARGDAVDARSDQLPSIRNRDRPVTSWIWGQSRFRRSLLVIPTRFGRSPFHPTASARCSGIFSRIRIYG